MKILACLDASPYAASVCNSAAWVAQRTDGRVELLHVIQRHDAVSDRHDLSGAIGLGVKSSLMEELARIGEEEGKLARQRGQMILDAAGERLADAGIRDVTLTHRHGGIVETIIEREADADVVIIGKRGASSGFAADHIGSKVERVVRASTLPVLIAAREFQVPKRILFAFDGGASAVRAAEFLGSDRASAELPVHLLTAGLDNAHNQREQERAEAMMPNRSVTRSIEAGEPEDLIRAEARPDDLLVMGAYGHSRIRSLIVGSTTTAMIRTPGLSVLLFR
ncbi:universal stress protein UspA [Pacificimonas flava]|uniref:Universal stress protein UspA n=2 Tax=Pacificimonas TaxID=1960290 RepID=A0A219B6B6_9SPHN|nr:MULTISPECIES: universal stress protein [Pacificimonas]MBZ6379112.1 universal stress protein [Pacificimonas aurantium]OWV33656.1 universal stress protein UspA [Pacificimonas flava]